MRCDSLYFTTVALFIHRFRFTYKLNITNETNYSKIKKRLYAGS